MLGYFNLHVPVGWVDKKLIHCLDYLFVYDLQEPIRCRNNEQDYNIFIL